MTYKHHSPRPSVFPEYLCCCIVAVWFAIPKASKMKHIQNGFHLVPFTSRSLKFYLLIKNLMTPKFELPRCLCVRWERWTMLWAGFHWRSGSINSQSKPEQDSVFPLGSKMLFLLAFPFLLQTHKQVQVSSLCVSQESVLLAPLHPFWSVTGSGLIRKVVIHCFQSEVVFYALDR